MFGVDHPILNAPMGGGDATGRLAAAVSEGGGLGMIGGTTIGGHNAQLHVNNSAINIDHCTWPGTPVVEYISFDNSSFIVQNCTFPTYPGTTGPEMLHGVNGIPFSGYGIFRDNSVASNGNTATLRETAGSAGLNKAKATIDAFERVGLVRTLAEPNLTTTSGEAARFLAGGEFPVPTGQDVTGRVSVVFKPYGVALGFTPVVLGPGRISLKMSTEVSELTNVGSFTLNSGSGSGGPNLTVPGLNVRRAETVVELPSGGAMMIAGLLQSTTKQTLDSLPGLMQLPVLGALFRSRDFQNNESELVVIVTPYLARPGHPEDFQTPADGLQIATDQQTILLGRLNRAYGREPADKTKTYQGPFGYVVE